VTRYLAIACGVLVLLLGGAGLLLKWSYEDNGTLKQDVADRDAVLKQKAEDAELSARLIEKQQVALAALDTRANAAIQRIYHEPVTTTCARSAPMRESSRSLHDLFGGAGQPAAGRQPAAAVRRPDPR
jgi:hypothetical protein